MKYNRLITSVLIAVTLCLSGQPRVVYAQKDAPASIPQLLEQSGYPYTKITDGVWMTEFQGKSLPKIDVVATFAQDVVVLFVVLAKKEQLKSTPELMATLLRLNAEIDYVKVGMDKDGDAFVRTDVNARGLDQQELKDNIEQLAAAADVVYAAIKPYLATR
jgi:hypothetical protein